MTDREGAGGGLRQKRIGQLGRTPEACTDYCATGLCKLVGDIWVRAGARTHMSPSPHSRPAGAQGDRPVSGPGERCSRWPPLSPQTVRHDRRYWSIEGAATSTVLLTSRDADVQTPHRRQGDLLPPRGARPHHGARPAAAARRPRASSAKRRSAGPRNGPPIPCSPS